MAMAADSAYGVSNTMLCTKPSDARLPLVIVLESYPGWRGLAGPRGLVAATADPTPRISSICNWPATTARWSDRGRVIGAQPGCHDD